MEALSFFQMTSMGLRGSIDLSNRLVSSLAHRYTVGTLATACAGHRVPSSRDIDLSNRLVSSLAHRYTEGTLATLPAQGTGCLQAARLPD